MSFARPQVFGRGEQLPCGAGRGLPAAIGLIAPVGDPEADDGEDGRAHRLSVRVRWIEADAGYERQRGCEQSRSRARRACLRSTLPARRPGAARWIRTANRVRTMQMAQTATNASATP